VNEMGIIYIATNAVNGKQYVGQTRDFSRRVKWHLNSSRNTHFGHAIKKYGKAAFEFQQFQYPVEELNKWEQYWIKELNTVSPNGYNLTSGGDHCEMSNIARQKIKKNNAKYWLGKKMPATFSEKLRNANLGKKLSSEHREKLKGRIPWNKGKETPKDVRIKQSISASKRRASAETRDRMSKAFSGERNPFFGRRHTPETIEKLRKISTGRRHSEEAKKKCSIAAKLAWEKRKLIKQQREAA